MKLAFLSIGGHIHTQRWLAFFVEQGHEVHLFTVQPHQQEGVRVHSLNSVARPAALRYGIGLARLRGALRELQPDILHGHFLAGYGYWAACALYRPLVVTVWGDDLYERPFESWLKTQLARFTLRRADLVTGDSRDLLRAAADLGADAARCKLVQFGVDFARFRPDRNAELREQLGIPADAVTVLSARSFSEPFYNIDTIVRAAGRVSRDRENVYFLFAGYEGDDSSFRELAIEHGLEHRSRWLGRVPHDEFHRLLAVADILVSVPSVDGTAVSLLEGMAAGCGIIVSDLASNREWIRDGENGCVVAPRHSDELAARIRWLADHPQERRAFGARCVEEVRERADYRTHMAAVEASYEELIARYSGTAS